MKYILLMVSVLLFISCDIPNHDAEIVLNSETGKIRFRNVSYRVFGKLCLECHEEMISYNEVMKYIIPGDPMASRTFQLMKFKLMPPVGERQPTEKQMAYLKKWILEGAIN